MTRRGLLVVWVLLHGASAAAQGTVEVEVVDLAGGRAYVRPGESAGVRRGGTVVLGRRRYPILGATDGYALVGDEGGRLKVGDRGQATVIPESEGEGERLPAPEPLAAFRGQWPDPERPADSQHPEPVPLGPLQHDERSWLALSLLGGALVPLSGSAEHVERGELRARVHVEPLHELPLRLDADAAVQLWLSHDLDRREGGDARELPRVRQLEAAYGDAYATFAALGRLRYAARTLGMLDGARAQAELADGFTLGAFGGFVPDPLDGSPASDASRFGAEVGYEARDAPVRPRLSLTAHGSRFDGALDERKLSAAADLFPEDAHVGAYGELSLYDPDNPWGASEQELSAAGVDGSVQLGIVELGARVDLQRPERSRWLASYLPPGFLCSSSAPVDDTPCFGDEARYLGSADVDVTLDRARVGASLSASRSEHGRARQVSGIVHGSLLDIIGPIRLDAALLANEGTLVHVLGARVGLGAQLARGALDFSLHYRPAVTRYDADTANYLEHAFGAGVWVFPAPELSLGLDADAIVGRDVDVLLVQTLLSVTPSF
jgi:hypothetical protein